MKIKRMNLPNTITYKGNQWHLSMEYGEHGKEWKACYKRYFEFSEPETILDAYREDLDEALVVLKQHLKKLQATHTL